MESWEPAVTEVRNKILDLEKTLSDLGKSLAARPAAAELKEAVDTYTKGLEDIRKEVALLKPRRPAGSAPAEPEESADAGFWL